MGESELKTALLSEGEEQIRTFWQTAEEQVAKRRRELTKEQEQLRFEADQQLQKEVSLLRNRLLAEAQARAMKNRLKAEATLDKRLQGLAPQLLTEIAEENREQLWRALCSELPPAEWATIKVAQADQKLAARDFPTAEIELDDALTGGLIASNRGGGMRIDNSLDCRLRRAWPDLLPQMISALRRLVNKNETA